MIILCEALPPLNSYFCLSTAFSLLAASNLIVPFTLSKVSASTSIPAPRCSVACPISLSSRLLRASCQYKDMTLLPSSSSPSYCLNVHSFHAYTTSSMRSNPDPRERYRWRPFSPLLEQICCSSVVRSALPHISPHKPNPRIVCNAYYTPSQISGVTPLAANYESIFITREIRTAPPAPNGRLYFTRWGYASNLISLVLDLLSIFLLVGYNWKQNTTPLQSCTPRPM